MSWLTLRYIDADGVVHHHDKPRRAQVELEGLERVVLSACFPAPDKPLKDIQWFVGISDRFDGSPLRVQPMRELLTTYSGDTILGIMTLIISSVDGVEQEVNV